MNSADQNKLINVEHHFSEGNKFLLYQYAVLMISHDTGQVIMTKTVNLNLTVYLY